MSMQQIGWAASTLRRASVPFCYDALPPGVVAEMRTAAGKIQRYTRDAVVEVGKQLNQIKDRIEHGQFRAWVEAECQLQIRTAQRAMQVAQLVQENVKLTYLPPDGLLALASSTAPEETVSQILERIEAGDQPTAAEIKREVMTAKARLIEPTHARAEEAERLTPDFVERAAALNRLADMLVEMPGDRITEVVKILETVTSAEVAEVLRQRRPDLFDRSDAPISPEHLRGASGRPLANAPPGERIILAEGSEDGLSAIGEARPAVDHAAERATGEFGFPADPQPIPDRLEEAYQAMSAEDRAGDRDWVMRRLQHGDRPPHPSSFLARYLDATAAEQQAFRRRRVAEPIQRAA